MFDNCGGYLFFKNYLVIAIVVYCWNANSLTQTGVLTSASTDHIRKKKKTKPQFHFQKLHDRKASFLTSQKKVHTVFEVAVSKPLIHYKAKADFTHEKPIRMILATVPHGMQAG